jgi:hypothetical protein
MLWERARLAARLLTTLPLFGALAGAAAPARAAAWTEVHQTAADVKMEIAPNGVASVEHALALRVVMGPIKSLDLVGIDPGAQLEVETTAVAEDGRVLAVHVGQVELKPAEAARRPAVRGQTVRVSIDDPKGLKRGVYTVKVRYTLDLVATRTLVRDGALWRLGWTAPVAPEGFDTARFVIDLPPAPTEPRPVKPSGEDGVLASLRRTPERDELELVRPHVTRGEAVTWEARIDPKALPDIAAPELRAAPRPPPPPPNRWPELAKLAVLGALVLAFGGIVRAKAAWMRRACARAHLVERPLVPLPPSLRPAFAAAALACGVALEVLVSPVAGVPLVLLAAAIAVFRAPAPRSLQRGPGSWSVVDPEHIPAEADDPSWLDVGAPAGRRALALVVAVVAAGAIASRVLSAQAPWLVLVDALALVPVWFSGRAVQLRSECARRARATLLALRSDLAARPSVRVKPWARVPRGQKRPDEVRLLALPEEPLPGLIGIEVGFGFSRTPTGWLPAPQVLVRMHDGSAASRRLTGLRLARAVGPGRAAHERVAAVAPADADAARVRALVELLAHELNDRRASEPAPYAGPERRASDDGSAPPPVG